MENAIVLGGRGFIGSSIVERLRQDGVHTLSIDKKNGQQEDIVWSRGILQWEMSDFKTVFHFASPCSGILFAKDPALCFLETTVGMINVMEFAKRCGVRVIYPSSGSVYTSNDAQSEMAVLRTPMNLYAVAKMTCEQIAAYYREYHGVESCAMRIFTGYGDGEEEKGELMSVLSHIVLPMMRGEQPEIWGDGTQRRDFIYVKDIADVAVKLAQQEHMPEIINVASGEDWSLNEISDIVNIVLGTNIKPNYKPKPENYPELKRTNTIMLKGKLGFVPTLINVGIRNYIEYLRAKQQSAIE